MMKRWLQSLARILIKLYVLELIFLSCVAGFMLMLLAVKPMWYDMKLGIAGLLLPSIVLMSRGIYLLIRKERVAGIIQTTIAPIVLLIFWGLIGTTLLEAVAYPRDTFARRLSIPDDVPLTDARVPFKTPEGPGPRYTNDAGLLVHPEFDILQYGQPGMYAATIELKPDKPGLVYLKAWEITKNQRLSADSLVSRSKHVITQEDLAGESVAYESEFTIYEGDWGQPYAARFEVWLKPDDGSDEVMLMSKNFVIEGWQR